MVLSPKLTATVEPSLEFDLSTILYKLNGNSFQTFNIQREREARFSSLVIGRLRQSGALNHRAIQKMKSLIDQGNSFTYLFSEKMQTEDWHKCLHVFCEDYEIIGTYYNNDFRGFYANAVEEMMERIERTLHRFGTGEEVDQLFGNSSFDVSLRFTPSFHFDSVGGHVKINSQKTVINMFYWSPYKGDRVMFPMGESWLYQGLLHFLVQSRVLQMKNSELMGKETFSNFVWRNIFLACRAKVFEYFINKEYADALIRYYFSQGFIFVKKVYEAINEREEEKSLVETLKGMDNLNEQEIEEENTVFRGPFGVCLKDIENSQFVVGYPSDASVYGQYAHLLWRNRNVDIVSLDSLIFDKGNHNFLIYAGLDSKMIRNFLEHIHFRVEGNHIQFQTQRFPIQGFRFRILIPNPNNRKKWLCLIGGDKYETIRKYRRNAYLDIFFDYVFYQFDRVVAAGYFGACGQAVSLANSLINKLGLTDCEGGEKG